METFERKHNIVSILYALKEMIENHLVDEKEKAYPETDVRLRRSRIVLRKASFQAYRALKILRRLNELTHTNGHGNGKTGESGQVSLPNTWQAVVKLLDREFPLISDQVHFVERIPKSFPLIQCSQDDFQEIVYHLSKNSVQVMKERGEKNKNKLILRAQLSFSQKEEPYALITISDTGPGIPEAELPYIFHPFFTTKPNGEGNGLGLYLSKELVTQNHGRITVSSFEGCGTTFTLEFPLTAPLSNKSLTAL